jgi:uncharacterized membrane protein
MGYVFDFTLAFIPAIAVLWFCMGVLLAHTKRNWFVGIRTPWTLSSDIVWNKTHKLGGLLFKVTALMTLFGLFFGRPALLFFIIIPLILIVIITSVYSYVEYRKTK